MPSRFFQLTISQADYDKLHVGAQRFCKQNQFRIVEEVAPDDPSRPLLLELGYVKPPPPPEPAIDIIPEKLPTLEEWIAAGYDPAAYDAFIGDHAGALEPAETQPEQNVPYRVFRE